MSNVRPMAPLANGLCNFQFRKCLIVCTAAFDGVPALSRPRSSTSPGPRVDAAHSYRKTAGAGTDVVMPPVVSATGLVEVGVVGPRPPIGSRQQQAPQQQQVQHGIHKSKVASLAQALRLTPSQITRMLGEYPALQNYSHAQLADKVLEMARLLKLHPQQLSEALTAKPKVLGCSLGEFELRVRELQKLLGGIDTVSQLVLSEPKLLSWSPRHLSQRVANMSACLGIKQDQLMMMIKQHPQLLPASSHWVRALQLVQQLLQMAESAQHSGFEIDRNAVGAVQQQQVQQIQPAEQDLLLRHMAAVGQQIQQLGSFIQQQHTQQVTDAAVLAARQWHLARLQQQMQQMQAQLQHLQQKQQHSNFLPAAQQYLLQHPQLLLLPPEAILSHLATMQAQSGLSLAEVSAVVIAHPHLLLSDTESFQESNAQGPKNRQQYKQQRQQGQHKLQLFEQRKVHKHQGNQQQRAKQKNHQGPAPERVTRS